jgi:TolA-binding protein
MSIPQDLSESLAAKAEMTQAKSLPPPAHNDAMVNELKKLIGEMSDKIQSLETKLSSMNDKLDAQRFGDNLRGHLEEGRAVPVREIASDKVKQPVVRSIPVPNDPEAGFTLDEAVQNFRKALIIFQGMKYPEATLAFSDFLEKYPDHPLAGSAQFYISESYMRQKEYKLAIQEFNKVLTSYDRSHHVAETLKQLSLAEEVLKLNKDASHHRQLLTSLFPLSPAASDIELSPEPAMAPALSSTPPIEHLTPNNLIAPPTAPIELKP